MIFLKLGREVRLRCKARFQTNQAYYRISVKREAGSPQHPDGMISNHLHQCVREGDLVELAPPAGDFTLNVEQQTPLLSMLEYLISTGSRREIVWVHGSRNATMHAFRKPVRQLAIEHDNVHQHFFYNTLEPEAKVAGHYEGLVDVRKLEGGSLLRNADYYLCGPTPFIRKQVQDLTNLGVPRGAIHFEEFGPATLVI